MRRGDASARELADLALARIAALDPQLNAFGAVHADRALTEADAADRRRAAGEDGPLLGVPIAVKDEIDIGGHVTSRGTDAFTVPAAGRRRGRPPPARRRRGHRRQDEDARARALAVHGVGDLGRHPQPVGHRPDTRRLQRRVGRRGRGRDRARRARRRRRGLDPHPGRLHRPLRPQAATRPRPPRAARPGRQPLDRLRRAHALRPRLRDHARRAHGVGRDVHRRRARRARSAADRRVRGVPARRPRPPGPRRPRRAARHRRRPATTRSHGRRARRRLRAARHRDHPRAAVPRRARHRRRDRAPWAPRAPQPRVRPPGRARPGPDARAAARGRAAARRPRRDDLRRPRRAVDAGHVAAGARAPGSWRAAARR